MPRFPHEKPTSIASYWEGYRAEMARAAATVSAEALAKAEALLRDVIVRDGTIFSCGNGGSSAIANHLVCDFGKGARTDTGFRPRVQSLSTNPEILTAIGNDMSYADTFSFQLEGFARTGDLLLSVSSSGDSENIVRAVQWAKDNGVATIAMTGFSGGRSAILADASLHVDSQNYGVVEDLHQSLMHLLAQYIRITSMPEALIPDRKF